MGSKKIEVLNLKLGYVYDSVRKMKSIVINQMSETDE